MNQEQMRAEMIAWAQWVRETDALVLDTESSGGSYSDEIIQLGIVSAATGDILMDLTLNPESAINWYAYKIHGLSKKKLRKFPRLIEVWDTIYDTLDGRLILAYNHIADKRMLLQSANKYELPMPEVQWQCVMKAYSKYCGRKSHTNLANACLEMNAREGSHNAVSDALATARLIYRMAQGHEVRNVMKEIETNVQETVRLPL